MHPVHTSKSQKPLAINPNTGEQSYDAILDFSLTIPNMFSASTSRTLARHLRQRVSLAIPPKWGPQSSLLSTSGPAIAALPQADQGYTSPVTTVGFYIPRFNLFLVSAFRLLGFCRILLLCEDFTFKVIWVFGILVFLIYMDFQRKGTGQHGQNYYFSFQQSSLLALALGKSSVYKKRLIRLFNFVFIQISLISVNTCLFVEYIWFCMILRI